MHITASVLIFWFVALCNRCEVDGARSLESSAAASGAASSVKAAQRAASRDDDDIDEDDIDDDEGREEADDDDVDQELDDAEDRYRATLCVAFLLRFERNEKTLEDAEDAGLKEDLEEEASEEAYARAKAESGEGNKEPEDAAKARIRRLMDDLVAASLELREINRELDEL